MKARAKTRAPYFGYAAEVDIEISPDDLHRDGWHHESECGGPPAELPPIVSTPLADALASLHRQAHPSQHHDPAVCREEPCRSPTLAQIQGEPS